VARGVGGFCTTLIGFSFHGGVFEGQREKLVLREERGLYTKGAYGERSRHDVRMMALNRMVTIHKRQQAMTRKRISVDEFVDSRQRDERMSVAQRRLTLAECFEALQILQSFLLMIRSEWFGPLSAFSKVRDSWARYAVGSSIYPGLRDVPGRSTTLSCPAQVQG
jgi:hypothetical protein